MNDFLCSLEQKTHHRVRGVIVEMHQTVEYTRGERKRGEVDLYTRPQAPRNEHKRVEGRGRLTLPSGPYEKKLTEQIANDVAPQNSSEGLCIAICSLSNISSNTRHFLLQPPVQALPPFVTPSLRIIEAQLFILPVYRLIGLLKP
jgi:hypothetical protein